MARRWEDASSALAPPGIQDGIAILRRGAAASQDR